MGLKWWDNKLDTYSTLYSDANFKNLKTSLFNTATGKTGYPKVTILGLLFVFLCASGNKRVKRNISGWISFRIIAIFFPTILSLATSRYRLLRIMNYTHFSL